MLSVGGGRLTVDLDLKTSGTGSGRQCFPLAQSPEDLLICSTSGKMYALFHIRWKCSKRLAQITSLTTKVFMMHFHLSFPCFLSLLLFTFSFHSIEKHISIMLICTLDSTGFAKTVTHAHLSFSVCLSLSVCLSVSLSPIKS